MALNPLKVFKRNKNENQEQPNSAQREQFIKDKLQEDFAPLVNKSRKALSPVKSWLQSHGGLSFIILMIFIVCNFFALQFFFKKANHTTITDALKKMDTAYTGVKNGVTNHATISDAVDDYRDYEKVKAMNDSVRYLLKKGYLTRDDSIQFVRIVEELNRMKSKVIQNPKQKSPIIINNNLK